MFTTNSRTPGRDVKPRLAHLHAAVGLAAVLLSGLPASVLAQTPAPTSPSSPSQDDSIRLSMPAVTVTAQKTPEDKQKVPVSVTAVTEKTIDDADIHWVSEAGIFAPNTFFTEASARKLSNARFRGVGSSPAQPRHHDLFRRRAAAERQLVEHRAPRHRSDRVRPRPAERALRPQHPRRSRQHHERAAVALGLDRHVQRALRQLRFVGDSRWRVRPGDQGHVERGCLHIPSGARRLHGE